MLQSIERHIDKIGTYLPHLPPDHPGIDIVVSRTVTVTGYRGSMLLSLPRKLLYVRFAQETLDAAFQEGFRKLLKEIQTYKGMHFSADSTYKNHESIRTHHL